MSTASTYRHIKRALARQRQKPRALRERVARLGGRSASRFVDLSSNNGRIPRARFEHYAKAHDLVAIKATEGTGYVNPYFAEQVKWCRELGLLVMPYHFADPISNPSMTQAEEEARHFVRTCKAAGLHMSRRRKLWFHRDHLPGCLDYEQAHPEGKDQTWERFWTRKYRALTQHGVGKWKGRKSSATLGPSLYGGSVIRERFTDPLKRIFWLAAYTSSPDSYWPACIPKRLRAFWQYSDQARQGFSAADASVSYCTVRELVQLAV